MIGFSYLEPATLDEALAVLDERGEDAKAIAGGTGLINLMKQQLVQPAFLVGLRRLRALGGIQAEDGLRIGGLVSLREIETSELVRRHAPLLAETCRQVATIRIRTMATIGGALAHADPNQDPPPALIALDARVRLRSAQGARELPIGDFFTGYYETATLPEELVTEVVIPPQPAGTGAVYLKFLPQTQDDYATVSVAARVSVQNGKLADVRVALGAAGSTPVRANAVEEALRGQAASAEAFRDAAALVASAVDPTSDFRGSADYKRNMAVVFVERALAQACARAGREAA